MAIGMSQFTQVSVLGPITPPSRQGILTARTGKCGYMHRLAGYISGLSMSVASFWYKYFVGASTVPWPLGPTEFTQLSVLGPIPPSSRWGILTAGRGKWGYCTD